MSARSKKPFVTPVRPVNMIWLLIAGVMVWAGHRYGTPHLRVEYVWSGRSAAPVYHSCRYWGLHSFRADPAHGTCPVIVLARAAKDGL